MVTRSIHIIGAGVSGLTLAYELVKKGCQVRIYESTKYVGGIARTEEVRGVRFDCGPHLFHSNNALIKDYWKNLLENKLKEPDLFGANYKNGKVYEYPLSRESINKQFKSSEIKIIEDQLRSRDLDRLGGASSYEEYVRMLAGPYLSELFFKQYPKKLWGIETSELSAKFAPRRIEIREKSSAFHSGENKWAGVIDGGCGTLSEELERRLLRYGISVEYNQKLTEMKGQLDGVNSYITDLVFNNGELSIDVSRDVVVSTIPVTKIAEMLGIKTALWYRGLKICCFLVDQKLELLGGYDWLYFDAPEIVFHRVTSQNSFSEAGIPDGKTVLSCEISYQKNDSIDALSAEELTKRCSKNLVDVGIIKSTTDISLEHLIDAEYVYPGIDIGHEGERSRVFSILDNFGNLYRHGALAEFEYSDLQVLTAKSIDLATVLTNQEKNFEKLFRKRKIKPRDEIYIDGTRVGVGSLPYVIAEVGLNHNGSVDMAKNLIAAAKKSGASAVKFQTYGKGRVSKKSRTSLYYEDLIDTQESISDLLDRVMLSEENLKSCFQYAREIGITLFSTPFDLESLELLDSLGSPAYKISSMDIVNIPLIKAVASKGKPIIISTGMSTISNIEEALDVVLTEGNDNIALLHCVSAYPCPSNIANLPRISKIAKTFDTITGYSDHTIGLEAALASVALGANIIEKHFTLDKKLDGPDHNFSIIPEELEQLCISASRVYESCVSHGMGISNSEIDTALNLRRSLFYARDILMGESVSPNDLVVKSPGIGIHPRYKGRLEGAVLKRNALADTPVSFEDFIGYGK